MTLILRHKTYHLKRRVPVRFHTVEGRKVIWISLGTDSEKEAEARAISAWREMLEGWEARLAGDTGDAEQRFEAARRIAQRKGFRYISMEKVLKLPTEEFLQRVEATQDKTGRVNMTDAAALLGAVNPPEITVTGALACFWDLADDRTIGKSEDQVRRWRNPRIKAVKNFVSVVGDIPIADITADHMLDFREWWGERIKSEGLTPNSANKDFTHLGNILKTVNDMKRLGLSLPMAGFSFKGGKSKKRVRAPFSREWIETKLLAPGALDGLDAASRLVFLMVVNTGARPSEIAGLLPHHVDLDNEIPKITIAPEGRALKNENSDRKIPLAGVSLDAAREAVERAEMAGFEQLFPEYFGKDRISYVVNRYLRENKLLEGENTTFYSLRHSFEDRMIEVGILDRVRRDLFGHALQEERYGSGGGDEVRYNAVRAVAL